MKRFLILLTSGALLMTACNSGSDSAATVAEKAEVTNGTGVSYSVDTTGSKLEWYAAKQTGKHNGLFLIKDGSLMIDNGQLTGGSFDINVAALAVTDLQGEDKSKLEGHLKSPDFLQVDKFPAAKFEITKVEVADSSKATTLQGATHLVSGNLTLKDSTKNVTFPAKIIVDNNKLEAKADFVIDRSDWGISYKGPNNPQDWFIKKEVTLKLDLLASK
jgi:polyisoprenoid-binding protein YceI